MLFVGFDLGTRRHEQTREVVCIWAMLVRLGLWGAVSLYFVPSKRLADTFIPYSLATHSIGGQTGRLLISLKEEKSCSPKKGYWCFIVPDRMKRPAPVMNAN